MHLTLIRHGRSAHVHRGWLRHADIHTWRVAYDAAGIMADDAPPDALRAGTAPGLLVASDLRRAIESAARLYPGAELTTTPLVREVPLPVPALGPLRLPLGVWGTIIALEWLRAMRSGASTFHADACARAKEAAEWLTARAEEHRRVTVVTHGAFRRYLANALVAADWKGKAPQRYSHWSAWEFERYG